MWDMTAGTNDLYVRFMLYISDDITMGNTDEVALLEFWSSTNTAEAGVYLNYTTANGLRLGIGKASAAQLQVLTTGEWHCVEVFFDPAGATNGTLDGWLDGVAYTQVASLSNGSITSGSVGFFNTGTGGNPATTTKGHVLIDEIITDDAQVYPPNERFPEEMLMTASGHVFVGNGVIENVTLLSGGAADNVVQVFDTDVGSTQDASAAVLELRNTASSETVDPAGVPVTVRRGAYVSMSGTNPRALVKIGRASAYHSDAAIRSYGAKRHAAARAV